MVVTIISFFAIPVAAKVFKKSGIKGVNLNSKNKEEIPESLGLVIGMLYIITIITLSVFLDTALSDIVYISLMTMIIALLLGFIDDIVSIRWRYKILIPLISAIPLILNYTGSTSISFPIIGVLELGLIYTLAIIPLITVYMANSINIHAGVNLLEVGQVLVLAIVILTVGFITNNVFAIYMIIPLIGGSVVLGYYNRYPAKVFVGNSFTYFAGMALITIAVLSNMEKLVILCTFPQLINFLYSLLDFKGKTKRHRKPVFNPETGLMEDSGNHTLLNLILRIKGPMSEKKLSLLAIFLQIINAIIVLLSWIILITI
ncbi:MAG: UDP-N-acetylglucosamine--dolichyl-phosphate N-acetylglucosaminephosphotransferase [Candidatus Odinarchaeia archaeon]